MTAEPILFTPLELIKSELGSVRHAMRINATGYHGFEEVYFSSVNKNKIKGWKKHLRMTMNLVVCHGSVRFAVLSENNLKKASLYLISGTELRKAYDPTELLGSVQGLERRKSHNELFQLTARPD